MLSIFPLDFDTFYLYIWTKRGSIGFCYDHHIEFYINIYQYIVLRTGKDFPTKSNDYDNKWIICHLLAFLPLCSYVNCSWTYFVSVANFHLRNGAVLWRINWMADTSTRGMASSFGLMVNYRYYPDQMADNSKNYIERRTVAVSDQVLELVQPPNGSTSEQCRWQRNLTGKG